MLSVSGVCDSECYRIRFRVLIFNFVFLVFLNFLG